MDFVATGERTMPAYRTRMWARDLVGFAGMHWNVLGSTRIYSDLVGKDERRLERPQNDP